jgi:hypothetical protein
MTAQEHPYPRVEMLIDIFGDWLKHRRELSEIRQMDRGDFDRIASELRVSPGELDTLVRRGPHAADELPKLLRALGIDQADLARTEPMVLRDMERVCASSMTSANATASSPPAPPPSTMRDIA